MPSIELPIRSLSIIFLIGAVVAILQFPEHPLTPDLSYSLFYWFVAFGVVRWVEHGILFFLPSDRVGDFGIFLNIARFGVHLSAFGFFVWYLIKGIQYFVSLLDKL